MQSAEGKIVLHYKVIRKLGVAQDTVYKWIREDDLWPYLHELRRKA